MPLFNSDPPCACQQTSVDRFDPSGCWQHDLRSPLNQPAVYDRDCPACWFGFVHCQMEHEAILEAGECFEMSEAA